MLSSLKKRKPQKNRRSQRGNTSVKPLNQWTVSELGSGLSQLWNAAQLGVSIFNTEVKMFDNNFGGGAGITYSTAGSITGLSLLTQGTNYNNREGISLRTVAFLPRFSAVYLAANPYVACRTIVVQDQKCLGAAPAVTDILESADINSQYQHVSVDRYRILMDWTQNGSADRLGWHKSEVMQVDSHIAFRDATATATSQGSGSVWMLTITDAVANYPVLYGTFRMLYIDN